MARERYAFIYGNSASWPKETPSTVPSNRPKGFCSHCLDGDHSVNHAELGCMTLMAKPPHDVFCRCEVRGAKGAQWNTAWSDERTGVM
jgi:hypothetical protein